MDQDGFSLFIAVAAVTILVSGLVRGAFEIQSLRASRSDRPLPYWLSALALGRAQTPNRFPLVLNLPSD